MHPAYSVILFTTASGAGYGMLFWYALLTAAGLHSGGPWARITILTVALGLVTVGLLASTRHLGHPERAYRALSQWRSSWLSREGVAAIATYVPAGLFWVIAVFGMQTPWSVALALLSALGAAATVYCTGMIYASLRTIRQWNLPMVPAVYLALAAASGALLVALFLAAFGAGPGLSIWLALAGAALAGWLKVGYWRRIDADPGRYTAAMALGLPNATAIHQLDPPHTRPNFVMREMGYAVARKHAQRLRHIALAALAGLPVILTAASLVWPAADVYLLLLATLSAALGLVIERWLFFAEATHVAMLYYGRDTA